MLIIEPSVAEMIIKHFNNRNVSPNQARINRYAYDMTQGKFVYNGDSIRFDKDGILLDGQNRLMASVKSKCSFKVDVVVGLETSVFETIDQGRSKTKTRTTTHIGPNDWFGVRWFRCPVRRYRESDCGSCVGLDR